MYYPNIASATSAELYFFLIETPPSTFIAKHVRDALLTVEPDTMAPPAGHFAILYFAAASTYTKKTSEHLPAPIKARDLFALLEERYTGIKDKVLSSCAVTVNLEYVDIDEEGAQGGDKVIGEGDEVAIIPPVSSG
jgi:molybdopterin converting factor small subunit